MVRSRTNSVHCAVGNTVSSVCYAAAERKVFKLSFEYLHIYNRKMAILQGKNNNKITSLMALYFGKHFCCLLVAITLNYIV